MSVQDLDSESDTEAGGGGEMPKPHTIQLELVGEPGQLLTAFKPISDNGGNLLSVFHGHGSLTPYGHVPMEVDPGRPPDRFAHIVEALRNAGVNVIRTDAEHFGEKVMVILVGGIVDSDLLDTLHRIESSAGVTLQDLSLSARKGTDEASSARLRLAIRSGRANETFGVVRDIAAEKELHVVEPLAEGSQ